MRAGRWPRRLIDDAHARRVGPHGSVKLDEFSILKGMSAPSLYLAIDAHITTLDEFACLGPIFNKARKFQELSKADSPANLDCGDL